MSQPSRNIRGVSEILERPDIDHELTLHRRQLTGYCYRMLGSGSEAEDAVQETLVRAWRNADHFEGRSSVTTWLYQIAHNVCVDMLRSPQRRSRPMDLGPSSTIETAVLREQPEHMWVQPVADARVIDTDGDPSEVVAARESIRLAFVAALQHLPPRQRAALILCEVLRWSAAETAVLLESSVASVNSALQRARATLESVTAEPLDPAVGSDHDELLTRYVDAFERYDMDALVEVLHHDAVISMPPHDLWLEGAHQVVAWMTGPGVGCRGSKLVPLDVNGTAGFASYKPGPSGRLEAWAIQVIDVRNGLITGHHNFLGAHHFGEFGLPTTLDPTTLHPAAPGSS